MLVSAGIYLAAWGTLPLKGREPARIFDPKRQSEPLSDVRLIGSILNHLYTDEPWELVPADQVPPQLLELLKAAGPDPFAA